MARMAPLVTALAWPVLAQILLTFVALLRMGAARYRAAAAGKVRLADVALSGERWPEDCRKLANNAANQFETPVLFYVLTGLAIWAAAPLAWMLPLAWLFVALRGLHMVVHTGSNDVLARFRVFLASTTVLMLMWLVVTAHLVLR
jgi:hypothetical protein